MTSFRRVRIIIGGTIVLVATVPVAGISDHAAASEATSSLTTATSSCMLGRLPPRYLGEASTPVAASTIVPPCPIASPTTTSSQTAPGQSRAVPPVTTQSTEPSQEPAVGQTPAQASGPPPVDSTATTDAPAPLVLGVNTANAPNAAEFTTFSQTVGRRPAIVMWYQSFSEPLFYSSQVSMVAQDGATPLITWAPELSGGSGIPLSAISNGDYDSYLTTQAQAAKAWGIPIDVRFAHEMNLAGSSYGPGNNGNTPAAFVSAWRHVVQLFRQARADNVKWVWSPNVDCGGACGFDSFYPGDAWTDWVALDGYNYSSVDGVPWMSFQQVFGTSYADITKLTTKPLMIAETASTESGGDKAAWITQALTVTIPTLMPRIRALVWFDRVKEANWTVNSSATSASAFRDAVDTPLWSGSL